MLRVPWNVRDSSKLLQVGLLRELRLHALPAVVCRVLDVPSLGRVHCVRRLHSLLRVQLVSLVLRERGDAPGSAVATPAAHR